MDKNKIDIMKKKLEATRLDVAIGEAELKLVNIQNEVAIVKEQMDNLIKKKTSVLSELDKLRGGE